MLLFVVKQTTAYFIFALFLYFLTEFCHKTEVMIYRILLGISLAVVLGVSVLYLDISLFLSVSFLIIAAIVLLELNETLHEYIHIRETYESLLNDYRIQKRKSFQNERNIRMEERHFIAREMHDSVGHKLTALLMQIELFSYEHKDKAFDMLKKMVAECLEETRKAVRVLQVDETQGISSLVYLIKKLESENTVNVHCTTKQGVLSLPTSNLQNAILYRSIQEGLTNAMKYGSSKEVFITLGVSPIGHLTFEIKNTYIHKHPIHLGFGLDNMKKRLEEIGGRLDILQVNQEFILLGNMPIEGIRK